MYIISFIDYYFLLYLVAALEEYLTGTSTDNIKVGGNQAVPGGIHLLSS